MVGSTFAYTATFEAEDLVRVRQAALRWAQQWEDVVMLDGQGVDYPGGAFPSVLAAGAYRVCEPEEGIPFFQTLRHWHALRPCVAFGYFTYDLKNQLEDLQSRHAASTGFPVARWFEPLYCIHFEAVQGQVGGRVTLYSQDQSPAAVWQAWQASIAEEIQRQVMPAQPIQFVPGMTKAEYVQRVRAIQADILEGEVYELNMCQAFVANHLQLDPVATFWALHARSPMPFAAFVRTAGSYLMCASPERFLRKTGDLLCSQPIKGTIRRGRDAEEDNALRHQLRHDEKELAENMMIVDLVRNDLARSAVTGSVKADELFGIYTFAQVHQMISTVRARLSPEVHWTEAIAHAFPMGSMTGAPKIRAMQLIDQYETFRRGLYSGAVGYITPVGDFDLNVVIRSLFYEADSRQAFFAVGSAITYDADPQREYEECLLKAKAILDTLAAKIGGG